MVKICIQCIVYVLLYFRCPPKTMISTAANYFVAVNPVVDPEAVCVCVCVGGGGSFEFPFRQNYFIFMENIQKKSG